MKIIIFSASTLEAVVIKCYILKIKYFRIPNCIITYDTGSVDQQYSIGELKQWCQSRRSGRDVTAHVRELFVHLQRYLESAEDGSEPAPGLVKVVALVKAAFEGEGAVCRANLYLINKVLYLLIRL